MIIRISILVWIVHRQAERILQNKDVLINFNEYLIMKIRGKSPSRKSRSAKVLEPPQMHHWYFHFSSIFAIFFCEYKGISCTLCHQYLISVLTFSEINFRIMLWIGENLQYCILELQFDPIGCDG